MAHQFFDNILERFNQSAHVKTVYGEPVQTGNKTVIPVATVRYSFGGGWGSGKDDTDQGEGGGGGGGVRTTPVGVLEITPETTRFVEFRPVERLFGAALIGILVGTLLGGRRR